VAVIMASLINPLSMLPLLPHILVQAYSVAMVRQNSSLCQAPLLAHPLTAARIRSFHSVMQLVALALPGGWAAADRPADSWVGEWRQMRRAGGRGWFFVSAWTSLFCLRGQRMAWLHFTPWAGRTGGRAS